jgi:hypothetical protein
MRLGRAESIPMSLELDHVFVWTSAGAPEAERLKDFGLTEGASNTHPGQGTACRRFFFQNAYLELLWVSDPVETQSEAVRPIRLWERWCGRDANACPFGFIFRPAADPTGGIPFPVREYRPAYLTPPLSIAVGTNADVLVEPLLFYLPFARRPDRTSPEKQQPLHHAAGLCEMTSVELVSPHAAQTSPSLRAVVEAGLVRLCAGPEYRVELGFDGERQARSFDFRPALPVVLR